MHLFIPEIHNKLVDLCYTRFTSAPWPKPVDHTKSDVHKKSLLPTKRSLGAVYCQHPKKREVCQPFVSVVRGPAHCALPPQFPGINKSSYKVYIYSRQTMGVHTWGPRVSIPPVSHLAKFTPCTVHLQTNRTGGPHVQPRWFGQQTGLDQHKPFSEGGKDGVVWFRFLWLPLVSPPKITCFLMYTFSPPKKRRETEEERTKNTNTHTNTGCRSPHDLVGR